MSRIWELKEKRFCFFSLISQRGVVVTQAQILSDSNLCPNFNAFCQFPVTDTLADHRVLLLDWIWVKQQQKSRRCCQQWKFKQLRTVSSCTCVHITARHTVKFWCFSECLVELEPMVRKYDEIDFLEALLEIKRSKVSHTRFLQMITSTKCWGARGGYAPKVPSGLKLGTLWFPYCQTRYTSEPSVMVYHWLPTHSRPVFPLIN